VCVCVCHTYAKLSQLLFDMLLKLYEWGPDVEGKHLYVVAN